MREGVNPWRDGVLILVRVLLRFPITIAWMLLGLYLALYDWPEPAILGMPTGLALLLALTGVLVWVTVCEWDPEVEAVLVWAFPRADLLRRRERLQEEAELWSGYAAALALGLVLPVADEHQAKLNPWKWLPEARLVDDGDSVTLVAVQGMKATTSKVLEGAEAYAPVVKSRPDWTRVERPEPDQIAVTWWRREPDDPLSETVPYGDHWATRITNPDEPMKPVTVGIGEDGEPFKLQVFGRQILVVGQSSSGKGSVLGSVLLALAPWIETGIVRVYGIDLKGGVELALYRALFHDVAYDHGEAVTMLARVSAELEERLVFLRAEGLRKWETPTRENPLILVLIDEAGSLTYQAPDTKAKAEADRLLKRITSTGRAPGVSVIAALQDPRKESLVARDLFLDTLALRMSKVEVKLALSDAAYEAGAHADRIPVSQPGTAYRINNETQEVERFRAFWVSDELAGDMSERYAAPIPKPGTDLTEGEPG